MTRRELGSAAAPIHVAYILAAAGGLGKAAEASTGSPSLGALVFVALVVLGVVSFMALVEVALVEGVKAQLQDRYRPRPAPRDPAAHRPVASLFAVDTEQEWYTREEVAARVLAETSALRLTLAASGSPQAPTKASFALGDKVWVVLSDRALPGLIVDVDDSSVPYCVQTEFGPAWRKAAELTRISS